VLTPQQLVTNGMNEQFRSTSSHTESPYLDPVNTPSADTVPRDLGAARLQPILRKPYRSKLN
jgi:hypothetical protein